MTDYYATLLRFELRQSSDGAKHDPEVTCTECTEVVCDAEHGDSMLLLYKVMDEHECQWGTCRLCRRTIAFVSGEWIAPEATGDDAIWRETCENGKGMIAAHEATA